MKRYLFFLNLLSLTAASYFGVTAFYQIAAARLDPGPISTGVRKSVSSPDDAVNRPFGHYQTIIERDLFKTLSDSVAKPQVIDIETLKKTELKLKLWGTVTGDSDKAYAVIEDTKERQQNLYRRGDAIQTATVKMILRGKVILTVEGKDEILDMEDVSETSMSIATRRKKTSSLSAAPSETPENFTLKRSEMEDALSDVNNLMKQVRIRPHFRDGKPDGLSVTGIRPGSIFNSMGLRNGDIIMGIDGQNIESVDDAMKLYESMKSSSDVQLQIKRRGRPQSLSYTIE